MLITVLIPYANIFPLHYKVNFDCQVGDLLQVSFRNQLITGIVWQINVEPIDKPLKIITHPPAFPAKLTKEVPQLIQAASQYYLAALGSIAKLVLPVDINNPPIKLLEQHLPSHFDLAPLNQQQQAALQQYKASSAPVLLKGITGSGKTEIYFHAVAEILASGKQALIMLPEIALSTQIIQRFEQRFSIEPVVWHSNISVHKKKQILRGIITGKIHVVIGTRSALFLPYTKLGLIVVDEEHDASYKQTEAVTYQARDMAVLRATFAKCKIILASATPAIESIYNAQIGKYQLVTVEHRFNDAQLPIIRITDMRQQSLARNCWITADAKQAIASTLAAKRQILIFLNRRGYAPLTMCRKCGWQACCSACSASMVLHRTHKRLECHHCGAVKPMITECPECQSADQLILCGPGIERIYEEIQHSFPECKICLISKEQTAKPQELKQILATVEAGAVDILIGTQIITKGYHFAKLNLVIVVDADFGLNNSDLRSSETTFQLLHQVAGRAGREQEQGTIILQTYQPDSKIIQALAQGDSENFISEELIARKNAELPPFSRAATITVSGTNADKTREAAMQILRAAPASRAKILGPSETSLHKLKNQYRYRLLIIVDKKFDLQKYLCCWQQRYNLPSYFRVKIDIDPYQFI